jgi:3-oxoacyl-(acyl-carrier-protein) synthase
MEPISVGATSDADHIITPSKEGPSEAVRMALRAAGIGSDALGSFDLHATATPGDVNEVELVRALVPGDVLVTARKGSFGHGMSVAGGWELTAQYLGYARGRLAPTTLRRAEVAEPVAACGTSLVFDDGAVAPAGLAGKLSMGIGGINACVVSRPLERSAKREERAGSSTRESA